MRRPPHQAVLGDDPIEEGRILAELAALGRALEHRDLDDAVDHADAVAEARERTKVERPKVYAPRDPEWVQVRKRDPDARRAYNREKRAAWVALHRADLNARAREQRRLAREKREREKVYQRRYWRLRGKRLRAEAKRAARLASVAAVG